MKVRTLNIEATPPYPIYLGKNLLISSQLAQLCLKQKKRVALLSDVRLSATLACEIQNTLKQSGIEAEIFSVPSGEVNKTRENKQHLEDLLFEKGYGRDSCFIALGGGMITDLIGYLASTYCRGVPWIALPTTLLAMVDASLGGKTGVNTPHGKNLIGTFYPPLAVIADVASLKSLPKEEWRNGIVEMIKHACIRDEKFFNQLETATETLFEDDEVLLHLIEWSCLIKKEIVEQDERESGMRELLNFGHTIGHVIESLEHYELSHGEAVAIGMLVEAQLSLQVGLLSSAGFMRLLRLLKSYDLPLKTEIFHNKEKFLEQLKLDKKSKKSLPHFVLLKKIGEACCEKMHFSFHVNSDLIERTLGWAQREFTQWHLHH